MQQTHLMDSEVKQQRQQRIDLFFMEMVDHDQKCELLARTSAPARAKRLLGMRKFLSKQIGIRYYRQGLEFASSYEVTGYRDGRIIAVSYGKKGMTEKRLIPEDYNYYLSLDADPVWYGRYIRAFIRARDGDKETMTRRRDYAGHMIMAPTSPYSFGSGVGRVRHHY